MAKPKVKMRSMFDPPESESETLETSTQPEKSEPPKIKDACPQCGGRSLKTVRPFEHSGHTHYCATICLSEDRTEAFYFTPRVETFDEQAAREEAKKAVAFEEISSAGSNESESAATDSGRASPRIPEAEERPEVVSGTLLAPPVIEIGPVNLFGDPIEKERAGALAERFLVPPFSVLDARQGYWKQRKAEWVAMGIKSEDGRGTEVLYSGDVKDFDYMRRKNGEKSDIHSLSKVALATPQARLDKFRGKVKTSGIISGSPLPLDRKKALISGVCHEDANGIPYESDVWDGAGTSIFDPVLCELAYKWFAPANGKVLDPFAGGSVRGIVAEKLGYKYTGIELRPEQIAANEKQAAAIGVAPRWIEGDSSKMDELLPTGAYEEGYDMIFACPPYYDLEQYSESNDDGSAKQTYAEFIAWYEGIFKACVKRLKWNRFAVIVVGEIRDENGFYRNFVGDTVSVMLRCGLRYYNEAILLTSIGSLPLRVNRQFGGYRKLGKTHQNVIVCYNGSNCEQIEEKFGKLL